MKNSPPRALRAAALVLSALAIAAAFGSIAATLRGSGAAAVLLVLLVVALGALAGIAFLRGAPALPFVGELVPVAARGAAVPPAELPEIIGSRAAAGRSSDPPPSAPSARVSETPAAPVQTPPRTLRDAYEAAVMRRVGLPGGAAPYALYDHPFEASPGEMLLWTLGGSACDRGLFAAMVTLEEDLEDLASRGDLDADEVRERLHALAVRARTLAWIHLGALEVLGEQTMPAAAAATAPDQNEGSEGT